MKENKVLVKGDKTIELVRTDKALAVFRHFLENGRIVGRETVDTAAFKTAIDAEKRFHEQVGSLIARGYREAIMTVMAYYPGGLRQPDSLPREELQFRQEWEDHNRERTMPR